MAVNCLQTEAIRKVVVGVIAFLVSWFASPTRFDKGFYLFPKPGYFHRLCLAGRYDAGANLVPFVGQVGFKQKIIKINLKLRK